MILRRVERMGGGLCYMRGDMCGGMCATPLRCGTHLASCVFHCFQEVVQVCHRADTLYYQHKILTYLF